VSVGDARRKGGLEYRPPSYDPAGEGGEGSVLCH
jgi:hypothetical protein